MHPDTHLYLHELRCAELRREAATHRRPARPALRARLGWTLVELGLRLVQMSPRQMPPRPVRI
ncbi:hypothetical protein [Streptomyces sp. NPDC051219]|uniref:hypothetical protein n=1 Tax=Streptomyces sp. NPDC051219 TaxID=3155283 RepID=UPI003414C8EE